MRRPDPIPSERFFVVWASSMSTTLAPLPLPTKFGAIRTGEGWIWLLYSLAGAGAEKSLGLLAPFGRFLELGKRDFFADTPMFLRPFRRNLSYFGIDVDQMRVDCPDLANELFTEVLKHFENGDFRPLPDDALCV